ncbi:PGF-CTERM sorting domain-containing protein [Halonotius sp. F2-221B]|uniref:BGTF surface domain-containing protein n=1 Tax=Halonotius sp. F2-221B TaxID=2731620 RepID=UPI00398AE018
MNDTSKRISATFLSVLMILSVAAVGFAAPAAAQESFTVEDQEISTDGGEIEINHNGADAYLQIDHSSLSDDWEIDRPDAASGNADETTWTGGVPNPASIGLTPPDDVEDGDTFDITVTIDDSSNQETFTLTVSEDASGPSYTLDGGPAPVGQSFNQYANLSGSIAWQGQDITVDSGLPNGDIQLRERIDTENTRLAAEYSVSGGSLTFDTEDREGGDYYLTTGSLDTNDQGIPTAGATFEISEQSLTASFDTDTVTLEGPNSDDEDFEFESNRFEYPINVSTASGDLAAEDLADIFVAGSSFTLDTSNVDEDDDTITLDAVEDRDDYVVDFEQSNIDAGEYEFVFSGADSTAEDTDTITVTESNQEAEFTEGVEQQAAGDVAEFNLTLEDTNDAFVQIGGDASNFVEVLYLEEDEDGPMTVEINTRLLGSSAASDAVYSTDNVDTLHSAIHQDPSTGDRLGDVLASGDAGGIAESGTDGLKLFEDDGQAINNDFNDYVDNIGIADDGANQLTRPPQPTDYQIAVGGTNNVDDAVFDADPGGEANNQLGSMTLELTQPQINGVTVHTAPEEAADDETDVSELVSLATPREEIAVEDRMIVQFEATGIYGGIVANATNYDDDFDFDRLTDDGVSTQVLDNYLDTSDEVTVEVVADEDIGNQEPLEVDLTASDSDTYLVLDQANDQFFLIADTSSDDAFANGDAPSEDEDFTATIEYDADEGDDRYEFDSPAEAGDRAANAYPAPFSSSDANFPYLAQGDVISESAGLTVAPRAISFDNLNEDGQLEAPAGESAEISATTNVAPGSDAELRVTSTDASSSFRQGNDVNITEDGSITTTFDLSGQETGDVFDTNFRVEGSAVDSVESVVVESVDQDDGEETNETETDDGEEMDDGEEPADDGETNETTDDGESTDDGTPGFGAVVALIALIGAALLAVRRQD